ncbi:MAG: serine hydrolase [Gemmatimonadaceae bacterium]
MSKRLSRITWAALVLAVPQLTDAQAPASTRSLLADLDVYIPKALADWKLPGVAVGIVKDDSLIYAKGFGVRDVGKPEKVDDATLFAIGSNTKFFTAVAAGMLQDDGKLDLDDKATKHLPWFQLYDPYVTREITLRDMMSHRSGLGRRGDGLWYGTPYSRDEILRRVRLLAPNSSFRSEFGYQNIMFLGAGQAIAAAAGMSWDDVIMQRIFQPLGMTASSTSIRHLRGASNVASPHQYRTGGATVIPWRDIDNIAPAGSINSNVQDMARWMRFILAGGAVKGRTLLSARTLAELTAPHIVAGGAADTLNPSRHFSLYALGIGVSDLHGVKILQHTGGIDGMLSFVAMVPEKRLGIVVLTNTTGHNNLYTSLGNRVLDAFLGGPVRDWSAIDLALTVRQEQRSAEQRRTQVARRIANTQPSRPLSEYAGTYRHEMYGDVVVSVENGALRVKFASTVEYTLEHFHYDTFTAGIMMALDDGSALSSVRFTLDGLGRPSTIDIQDLGEFRRPR